MAVTHIKSNIVADFTGTVTVFDNAGASQTMAATDLVRPSDWNSAHGHLITLGGNTAGASTVSGTNIVYAGGNNITLSGVQGANVATITIAGGGGAGDGVNILAAGTQTANTTGTVAFLDSNGIAWGMSNNSQITASYTQSTHSHSTAPGALAAGTQTATSGTIVFADSNGVAFGLSGSTQITASYTQSTHSHSTAPGALAAGTQTATSGTIVFVDSNGLAFGMSGSTQITGSYSQSTHGHSLSMFAVSNTTQSSSGTQNVANVSFAGAGAVSVGVSNGSVVVSAPNTVAQTNQTVGGYFVGNTTGQSSSSTWDARTVSFDGAGIVSVGASAGSIRISATQSNQAFSADASSTFQTLSFQNSNGFTFSNNAGAIRASYSVPVVSNAIQAVGSATGSGTNTSRFAADDHVHAGVFSMGVSTGGNIAGDTRVDVGRFVLAGGANITLSQATAANALNTISIVGPAPGAAAITQTIGISNITQGGSTAGTTGGVTGDDIQFVFVPGSNITMSQSINGSSGTLSIFGPSGGAAATIGGWEPIAAGNNTTFSSLGQNSVYLQKVIPDVNYSFNNLEFRMSGSFVSSTNSQVAVHSIRYGLYSLETNNSYNSLGTSSMVISASFNSNTAMGYTISQGAASFTTSSGGTAIASLMSGLKHLYLPFTSTITAGGNYAVAILISSATTVGTSPFRMALLNQSIINNLTMGKVHATTILASNATFVGDYNQGVYATTTGALPAAIAKSDMTNAISQARLYFQFDV